MYVRLVFSLSVQRCSKRTEKMMVQTGILRATQLLSFNTSAESPALAACVPAMCAASVMLTFFALNFISRKLGPLRSARD